MLFFLFQEALITECMRKTFILDYTYQGYRPEVKQKVSEMAVNGSGIRDTSPYLSPAIFVAHYTLIPSNPEEPFFYTIRHTPNLINY